MMIWDAAVDDHRPVGEDFMRYRWLRLGIAGTRRAIGLVFLVAIGCSEQEPLQPDPGVSPFYPGPSATTKASEGAPAPGVAAGQPAADAPAAAGAPDLDVPLRPEDVERQLRIAMRAAEKGDVARASLLFDRILALEPVNREALLGRAASALWQAQHAKSPEEKSAATEKAATAVRALQRAYERANPRERELYARVTYQEIRLHVEKGQFDRAVAVLKEVHDAGADPFAAIEHDPDMVKLRASAGYQALVKSIDAANLAKAKSHVSDEFARARPYVFDFNVKDLDDKPLSLDQFKGKVLLVDIWGTWCKPCREAIPGLIQIYHKQRQRGFDIIGLDYEQDENDPAKTRQVVKQFIKESAIPYRIATFDDALREKVPNLQGFPTTLLIDRTGKVRIQLTGGGPEALAVIDAAVEVLLAEPAPKGTETNPAEKPPADAKDQAKAKAPAPADTKGTSGPK
jgi:thiol-disulfide isomerase/thioredoxin